MTRRFYTTVEVARLFRVDPKTVLYWRERGLVPAARTPGGRRYRYPAERIDAMRAAAEKITEPEKRP